MEEISGNLGFDQQFLDSQPPDPERQKRTPFQHVLFVFLDLGLVRFLCRHLLGLWAGGWAVLGGEKEAE